MPLQYLRIEKTQGERIQECLSLLKQIVDDLEIPDWNPGIRLLKKRMSKYWEDGKTQDGRIPLCGSNRNILYSFPKWKHQEVEIVLRVTRIMHPRQLPSDLAAELEAQTNSAPQSDPAHPSPSASVD
jgi:hypothetical protein